MSVTNNSLSKDYLQPDDHDKPNQIKLNMCSNLKGQEKYEKPKMSEMVYRMLYRILYPIYIEIGIATLDMEIVCE